jgi:drug/metabolite transporter (DMT)-like permease
MSASTSDLRSPSLIGALAPVSLVVAGLIIFAGNYDVRKGENGGTTPAIGTAIICVVLAAVLFGYVVPRARNVNRTAVILGVVGFVSLVAFWSGVTPVLAAAAIAVAPPTTESPRSTKVAQGAAAAAAVAALVVTLTQSHLF